MCIEIDKAHDEKITNLLPICISKRFLSRFYEQETQCKHQQNAYTPDNNTHTHTPTHTQTAVGHSGSAQCCAFSGCNECNVLTCLPTGEEMRVVTCSEDRSLVSFFTGNAWHCCVFVCSCVMSMFAHVFSHWRGDVECRIGVLFLCVFACARVCFFLYVVQAIWNCATFKLEKRIKNAHTHRLVDMCWIKTDKFALKRGIIGTHVCRHVRQENVATSDSMCACVCRSFVDSFSV